MAKFDEELQRIAGNDQAETAYRDIARSFVAFYQEMRNGGMDKSLAEKVLVASASSLFAGIGGSQKK